jgi:hypothetical protein
MQLLVQVQFFFVDVNYKVTRYHPYNQASTISFICVMQDKVIKLNLDNTLIILGLQASLRISRLIPRVLKLTTM